MGWRWSAGEDERRGCINCRKDSGKEGDWDKDVEVASREGEEMEVGDMGGRASCV
jgi:hypothetical protein